MKQFPLLLVLLLSAEVHAINPVCDATCKPDPTSSTFASVTGSRPKLQHARAVTQPIAPKRTIAGSTQLLGSQSYSYAVPILSLPGRNGLDLNLTLYYNSQVWLIENSTATFNADRDFPSYGFRLDLGYLEYDSANNAYILTEGDGAKHSLPNTTTNVYDSGDSSYIHLDTSSTKTIYYKNGTLVKYEPFPSATTKLFRPIEIDDSNGNYITITYVIGCDQRIDKITDTLNRDVTFGYDTSGRLTSISQDSRTWTFGWDTNYTFSYNFTGLTVNDSPANNSTLPVITSVSYPNGTKYSFVYGAWGIVKRIERLSATSTLRNFLEYNYPTTSTALSDAPTYTQQTVSDNNVSYTWNYAVTKTSGLVSSSTVTDPAGLKTVSTFTTSGTAAGTVYQVAAQNSSSQNLRVITNTWGSSGTNVRLTSSTTTLSDTSQQSKVEFGYDSYGNVNNVKEYDFGLTLKRETATTYLTGANYPRILDRVSQVLVKDGSGTTVARTDFAYDQTTPTTYTLIPHHYDTWTSYRGNLTTITRYKNASAGTGSINRTVDYDTLGNVVTAQLDCCQEKRWTFDTTYRAYPTQITRGPSGGTQFSTSAQYNFSRGTITSATDENSKTTAYEYDSSDRLKKTTLPNLVEINTTYDDDGAQSVATQSNSFNSFVSKSKVDGLGRAIQDQTLNSATVLSIVDRQFDWANRVTYVSNPYASGTPVHTDTSYDVLGRVQTVTPPSNGSYSYAYSGNSVMVTDPAGKQRKTYTDGLGRLAQVNEPGWRDGTKGAGTVTVSGTLKNTRVCDPTCHTVYDAGNITVTVGSTTKTVYYQRTPTFTPTATSISNAIRDAFNGDSNSPVDATNTVGLTAKVVGANTNYSLSASVGWLDEYFPSPSFTATVSGPNLTGGTDPTTPSGPSIDTPMVTTYTYNALDNLTAVSQAALGPVNGQMIAGQSRSYAYDSLGRLTSAITPESGTTSYTYYDHGGIDQRTDARNVVTTYTYGDLFRLSGISYSDGTPSVSFGYDSGGAAADGLGRLTSMSDGSGSETYSYDSMGRISSRVKTVDSTPYTTSYGYNSLSALTTITYPSGRVIHQDVDAVGRLSSIYDSSNTYLSNPSYNAANQTLGFSYGNGVSASFTYNDHLQLNTLSYSLNSSNILSFTYGYGTGNNGQIQTITDNVDNTKSQTYTYDAWGRLSVAKTDDLISANTWKLEWGYDRLGNRLSQTQTGGTAANIVQPQLTISEATNRITTSGYAYDAAGNMTNDSIHTYGYDAENRIKSMDGGGTYVYDGNGLRIKKGSTVYVYSGTKVIAEYSAGVVQKEYVYSGSGLLATLNSSGAATYSHADHLSTRLETTSSGTTTRTYGHYPFGDTWYETETANKLAFTTYERDSDSNLDYAVMRYDSSRLGRFISPDPVAGSTVMPQSLNRYSYVANDPINSIDPLGLRRTPRDEQLENEKRIVGGAGDAYCEADGALASCHINELLVRAGGALRCGSVCRSIRQTKDGTFQFYDPLHTRKVGSSFGICRFEPGPDLYSVGTITYCQSVAESHWFDLMSDSNFSQVSDGIKSFMRRPWQFSWVAPLYPVPELGVGPAGSFYWNPATHNFCGSVGGGISAGHNGAVGPITSNTNPDNVMEKWSVSGGFNLPSPVGPGPGWQGNWSPGTGVAHGPTFGVMGMSVSSTYGFCTGRLW